MKEKVKEIQEFIEKASGEIKILPYISSKIINDEFGDIIVYSCLRMESSNLIYEKIILHKSLMKVKEELEYPYPSHFSDKNITSLLSYYKEFRKIGLEMLAKDLKNKIKETREDKGIYDKVICERIREIDFIPQDQITEKEITFLIDLAHLKETLDKTIYFT